MGKQWAVVAGVVALLAAGAVLGVKLAPQIFPVEVGSRAPDFRATDLATGSARGLADYRGQVVLLNVWATWCAPCRLEMPSMERLHRDLGPLGLRVVAVSVDEGEGGAARVREFARELDLSFEILNDSSRAIERIYQTTGVPESFVLNRDGLIVRKVIGPAEWDSAPNRDLIRRLLAQRS